jgi:hypothetical protein
MRTHLRYIPIDEVVPGMVLANHTNIVTGGVLRMSLPQGHALTQDNVHQLNSHHAEFLFIAEPDTRSDEQVALDTAAVAHRVMEIFEGADLSQPHLAGLFDQVLSYRNA